jgi:hypothetical protein
MDDDCVAFGEADELRELLEIRVVLVRELFARLFVMMRGLEVLLLVVAEDALVLHRELDALARFGAAVDEIAREDDAIIFRDREAIEQRECFVVAPVQIADDYRSIHFLRVRTRRANSS